MRALATHVRFAFRTLRRAPGFAVIAILCLGIGIGAITTMVEVVDLLLFRAPDVRAASEIVQVHFDWRYPGRAAAQQQTMISHGVAYGDYLVLRDSLHALGAVAGYHTEKVSLGRGAGARPVTAAFVTGTFFPLLGVQPALGRLITTDGLDTDGGTDPVDISYALWQTQFAGDASVIGRHITVGKGTYSVAGVTPKGFRGLEVLTPMDVWLPIGAAMQEEYEGNRQAFVERSEGFVQVIGRLLPHLSPSLAAVQAAALLQATYVARFGYRFVNTQTVATLTPIVPGLSGQRTKDASVALWLTGVAAIVLLIACANVAGLLLVRATDRRREVAIRLALGATRGQLAQLFLIEGLILAAVGGVVGVMLRAWGGAVIRVFLLPQLGAPYSAFDARILEISALVTIATGIVCGLVPALHTWRRDIAGAVSGVSRGGRLRQPYVRGTLLVGQVALAMALVAGAALFVSSWWNVRNIQLGFTPDHVLVGRMALGEVGYTGAEARATYEHLLEQVRTLPSVESASLASHMPFVDKFAWPISIPGVEPTVISKAAQMGIGPELNAVSASFFSTTGTVLRRGRVFNSDDHAGTAAVAIINEKMAQTFWPAGNALGQCIEIQKMGPPGTETPCSHIVGIVADAKTTSIRGQPDIQVYVPLPQRTDLASSTMLVLRTDGDPDALIATVRHAMQNAAAGLPFADVKPWSAYLAPEFRPWQLGASMFTLFGSVALVLAAVGLYGVFSYAVARRTREMGIRAALGARAGDLLRMVMLDGLRLTTVGVIIGIALAVGIGRVLAAMLVGVSGTSPVVLSAATAVVLGVTLLAVVLPAHRAARIDPAVALRDE